MRFIFSLAVSVFTLAAVAQTNVSNIRVQTMDHILIIQYDLVARADIEVFASFDGGASFTGPLQHLTGEAGRGIEPGSNKMIVWNVLNEFGPMDNPNAVIKIVSTNEVRRTKAETVQEYKPFRIDLGVGGWGSWLILNIEPKYAISPRLSVGGKFEFVDTPYEVMTFLATIDYHFTQNKFRPFIGSGFGVDDDFDIAGLLRAGFDISHFRFAVNYAFVAESGSYFGVTIGGYIGGGRRK